MAISPLRSCFQLIKDTLLIDRSIHQDYDLGEEGQIDHAGDGINPGRRDEVIITIENAAEEIGPFVQQDAVRSEKLLQVVYEYKCVNRAKALFVLGQALEAARNVDLNLVSLFPIRNTLNGFEKVNARNMLLYLISKEYQELGDSENAVAVAREISGAEIGELGPRMVKYIQSQNSLMNNCIIS